MLFDNYKGGGGIIQWHSPSLMVGIDHRGELIIEKKKLWSTTYSIPYGWHRP